MVLPHCSPRLRRRGRRPAPPRSGRSPRSCRRRRRRALPIALPEDSSGEELIRGARSRRVRRRERESLLGGIQGRAAEGEGGAQTGARGQGPNGTARLAGVRVGLGLEE